MSGKRQKRQKGILVVAVVILVIVIVAISGLTTILKKYSPSKQTADYVAAYGLNEYEDVIINVGNQIIEQNGHYEDGEVYLPFDAVRAYLNKRFFWDGTDQVLRYTLPEGIVNVTGETTDYSIGRQAMTAEHTIFHVNGGQMYLSLSFIQKFTNIRYEIFENPNRVAISDQWDSVEYTQVKRSTQVREKGGIKSAVLTEVEKGDLVTVLEELDSWTKVSTEDGFVGYMKKSSLGEMQEVLYENDYTEPTFSHRTRSYPINMAWHQVTNQVANNQVANVLAASKGVNVLSPTWFYLKDNTGAIVTLASADYVNYCHQRGVEVWALISNLENPDVNTTQILNTTSSRDTLVNNLVAEAVRYDLDGINVDFESLEGEAGVGFLQFLRELSLKCAGNDIVLSVDNYPPAAYNAFYSRDEQAVFADYIVLMAYDEHYNGSEEGSVASLNFVNKSVEDTLKEVPAQQLILGMPFYTRLWKLSPNESGEVTVTSEALGMSEAESRVAVNGATFQWLEDCGQYYAQYDYEGSTYKVWLEDQNSLEKKLEVMKANNLAGAAFWKMGYEKNTVWDTIVKYLQ